MENKKYLKEKKLSLSIQKYLLEQKYPESICKIKENELEWFGIIKPTALSREYNIKISYKLGKRPEVILYGNNIEGLNKIGFPHHFKIKRKKQEVSLCLHLSKEFNDSLSISDVIIPWTQEWLYFYEIWLFTGIWNGGGHNPQKL